MALKIAVQMDPIENIDIKGDSSFAILLEAENRGHKIFYYTPDNMSLDRERLVATGSWLELRDVEGDHLYRK